KLKVRTVRGVHCPAERIDEQAMPGRQVLNRQHKAAEPVVLRAAETFNHVALQLRILVRVQLVVLGELFSRLLEDNFVGRVTPCRAGGAEAVSESKSTMFCVMVMYEPVWRRAV